MDRYEAVALEVHADTLITSESQTNLSRGQGDTLDVAAQVPLIGASLVTTARLLAVCRDELVAAVNASAKGMTAFVDDPDAAVEAARTYVTDLVES